MPIRHLANVASRNALLGKAGRPRTKVRGVSGKDFAYFIPFFLTEKKSGKKERVGGRR